MKRLLSSIRTLISELENYKKLIFVLLPLFVFLIISLGKSPSDKFIDISISGISILMGVLFTLLILFAEKASNKSQFLNSEHSKYLMANQKQNLKIFINGAKRSMVLCSIAIIICLFALLAIFLKNLDLTWILNFEYIEIGKFKILKENISEGFIASLVTLILLTFWEILLELFNYFMNEIDQFD